MYSYTQDSKNKLNITWFGLAGYSVMTVAGVWINEPALRNWSAGILLIIVGCLIYQLICRKQGKHNVTTSLPQ